MAEELPQIIYDPAFYVSDGRIEGVEHFAQFGYNSDIDADVESTLWDGPTAIYVFPSDTGEAMQLRSTDAGDTQQILIDGLDSDWNPAPQVVTLNGTTPVPVPVNLARVNRLINIDSTEFAGTVIIERAGGGTQYCLASPVEQISTQVVYSVPNGYKAQLETSLVSLNKSGGADVNVRVRYKRRPFGGVFGTGARFGLLRNGTSCVNVMVDGVTPLTPKSDVKMTANPSAGGVDVSARLPFTLYKI